MNIDPKVEPWLISLLDGVKNSNNHAEYVATGAYAASRLAKALEGLIAAHNRSDDPIHKGAISTARAALAFFRGDAA